jgi:uncharacterized protein
MDYKQRISDKELQRKLNASEAAVSLKKLVSILDTEKIKPPKSLNIITGTGISYTRSDGINVISLASLGAF